MSLSDKTGKNRTLRQNRILLFCFLAFGLMPLLAASRPANADVPQASTQVVQKRSLLLYSNAPVFCCFNTLLGTGIVGGSMYSFQADGRQIGRLALDILTGKRLLSDQATILKSEVSPMFDWQQIKRWGVSAGRLPADSIFINRPATLWGLYQAIVISALMLFLVLAVFLVVLVMQNRRRRIAERSAKESEARYRVLVEQAPDAIVVYDVDLGRFVEANPSAEKLFGCSRSELLQSNPQRFYPPEQPDKQAMSESVNHNIERALAGEQVILERAIRTADNREVLGEVRLVRLPSKDRRLLRASYIDVTERKLAERAIKKSEEKFTKLFISNPAVISVSRLDDGRLIDVNKEYEKVFGYRRDEIIGRTSYELGLWVDTKDRDHIVRLMREEGRINDIELRMRIKNGTVHTFRYFGESIELEDTPCLLSAFVDVTERKRAEEELRENQVRLDLALQAAHMGVWRWEVKENKHYYDDLTCQLLGINMATFNGADDEFFKIVYPDDREKVKSSLARAIERDVPLDLTYRVVWPEGSIRYIASRSRLFRDDSGQPARFNGLVWDVTEQHLFEKELLEKERKYRSLFESANDGIFIQDETGFTDCNQKGAEMLGLTREEIIGRSPSDFIPERQFDGRLTSEGAAEKARAALRGIPQVFEWQLLRAHGSPLDVEITLSRIELDGKMYLQSITRDISERKRLEQEHLRAQKLESIGTLAGGIAHDFNNLLQGIFGYISLAKLKRDDRMKSLAALEEAEKALHMSVKLTNQLLTFSKGGKPIKKPVNLQMIIENATKFALSGSRNNYHIEVADGLWHADADEGQIGQVIQNIVLNADQAMSGGGKVEITARNVHIPGPTLPQGLEKGMYVEIAIRDTGIGIPEGYIGKIFDPYFTTKERGSGLGLATSYSIIKNHNGVIEVKSEAGKGTTFSIYLPATAALKKEVRAEPTVVTPGRIGRVLVMDDDPVILDVAGELIRALGHSAEFATQGKDAIEKYREAKQSGHSFDIVILDLTIRGGMGGAETLQRLAEIDPGVKAVVSSGYSDDAGISGYREQGFKAFLKKPYNVDELREVLNSLLNA